MTKQRTALLSPLKAHREAIGITQQQVAEAAGMFRNNISNIEAGKVNVTVDSLIKIAEAMGANLVITFAKR